ANNQGSGPLKATFLGITGQDYVGPSGQLMADGVPDWHIQLQGLHGNPIKVQIINTTSGIWEAPYNGHNWPILTQYGASGTADLWFDPASTPIHVKVFYSDSTTDEADVVANIVPIPSTLKATYLGATGQDYVGTV